MAAEVANRSRPAIRLIEPAGVVYRPSHAAIVALTAAVPPSTTTDAGASRRSSASTEHGIGAPVAGQLEPPVPGTSSSGAPRMPASGAAESASGKSRPVATYTVPPPGKYRSEMRAAVS